MQIVVTCECGKRFRAPESFQGTQTKCPVCARPLTVAGDRIPDFDVFISYAEEDRATADAICAKLEGQALRCWIAPRNVRPGVPWAAAIMAAIQESRAMVLVFSSHANQSPFVKSEVEEGVGRGIPLITFRVEDVEPSPEMALFIRRVHWLDALTPPLERHLDRLAKGLGHLLKRKGAGDQQPREARQDLVSRSHKSSWRRRLRIGAWIVAVLGAVVAAAIFWPRDLFQRSQHWAPAAKAAAMLVQVAFIGPEGMGVCWDATGEGRFDSEPLVCPGGWNFTSGAAYRLKLGNIPGRPGVELYPVLEIKPVEPATEPLFLTGTIPILLTEEDFDQVLSGNVVTKVSFLPNQTSSGGSRSTIHTMVGTQLFPAYDPAAEAAKRLPDRGVGAEGLAGADALVSTQLDPGRDPVAEAAKRGTILAILRIGNKDLQLPRPMPGEASASLRAAAKTPKPPVPTVSSPGQIRCYTYSDGVNYFALSLKPGPDVPVESGPHDVVVLFDTSASQTGEFRVGAMDVLQAMLAKLGAEDRVSLIGTDLNPVALSPGFVTPSGAEMAQALKKLIARQPLGSGDMEKALRMAMATFASDVKNNPAIVYIGSGTSLANLLDLKTMAALTAALVEQKAPVNSCPIGPKLDLQMLGVLASDTGGTMVPLKDISATEAGERLARAVRATIVYPVEVVWPAALTEVFPNRTPPLRTDRDTVLVGTYRGSGPLEIRMTADTPSGIRKLVWTLVPGPPQADNAFLEPLVRAVRHHGGLGYPIAGSHVLEEARHEFSFLVPLELARIAASKGDVARAKALAEQAIKGAPDDAPAAAEAYLIRGFAFAQENDLPNAISDCTKAIGLAPKYAAAYRLRGNVHYDRSDFDKAIADYTEAIRLEPGSPRTHYTRGRAYVQRRDFDKAIADFNEAIRLDPRDAKALQARAEAYQAKGDRAKAGADDAKAKATLKGRG